MTNKESLRALQSRLAERMQQARTQQSTRSWLAVECAGRGFLFPLAEAGEIFPYTAPLTVPHAKDWFLGVANLRGGLHGVVDLARLLALGGEHDVLREQARLVAFGPGLEINCALLVDRLAGLRSEDALQHVAGSDAAGPAYMGERFVDNDRREWQEMSLSALAVDDTFLKIVD